MAQYKISHYKTNTRQCYFNIMRAIKLKYHQKVPKDLKQSIIYNLNNLRVRKVRIRYIRPKYASATYVRHILRISYRYPSNHSLHLLRGRVQPEIYTLQRHKAFLIKTALLYNRRHVSFLLINYSNTWLLITHLSQLSKILNKKYYASNSELCRSMIEHQIGMLHNCWFFIPIEMFSLQNAYYRMLNFVSDMNYYK